MDVTRDRVNVYVFWCGVWAMIAENITAYDATLTLWGESLPFAVTCNGEIIRRSASAPIELLPP